MNTYYKSAEITIKRICMECEYIDAEFLCFSTYVYSDLSDLMEKAEEFCRRAGNDWKIESVRVW